ncbi:MAG: hypothetical protein KatS3mg009_2953 [Acidimicrobiia bacterium]|nr:MAG: hypothetical protein KatS3mg009_2953 [Acidimicrobiia bacterium]
MRAAVGRGELDAARLASYLRLDREVDEAVAPPSGGADRGPGRAASTTGTASDVVEPRAADERRRSGRRCGRARGAAGARAGGRGGRRARRAATRRAARGVRPRGRRGRPRPEATAGEAAVPVASAWSTDEPGQPVAGSTARSESPRRSAAQSAVNSERTLSRRAWAASVAEAGGRDHGLDGDERVEPRVGEAVDGAPLLDRRAVDLLDLAHEQRRRGRPGAARRRTRRPRRARCARARRRRRCRPRARRCATRRARARRADRAARCAAPCASPAVRRPSVTSPPPPRRRALRPPARPAPYDGAGARRRRDARPQRGVHGAGRCRPRP